MVIGKTKIGWGIAAVVLAGAALWYSGVFTAKPGVTSKPAAACAGHGEAKEANDHGNASANGKDDGHGHGEQKAKANLDPREIEKKLCEHNIRQVDCQECRYELGVVRVDPAVTGALTQMAEVREGDLGRTLTLTGEVQYDQTTVVDVLPAAAGKVVAVNARLGQKVRAGEVLAVLHSGNLGEAKAAYLEAQTAAEVAQQEKGRQLAIAAALEKLLAASQNGDAFTVPAETLGEWKSKLVNAAARLRQARIILDREKSLVAKQASSQAELETADREMQTAQADYTALLEEIQLNIRLDRLKAENASKLADAKFHAAKQRLQMLGLDEPAIQAVSAVQENGRFAQLEVRSPREGIITALNITEGKFVENSQTICTIADTSNLWVWCDLYERDLGSLHERLAKGEKPPARLKVTAFADPFPGAVDLLDSTVNETTRTVKVRIQVKNEQGKLRPGMFATVDIPLPEGRKVALVPRQAVLNDDGQTFAFVHWKDDLWLRRNVDVGRSQGDFVEILRGLSAGEKVVAGGGFLFKSDILRAKMGAGCAD